MSVVVIRSQCRTCSRYVVPTDLILGFCLVCFTERVDQRKDLELPRDVDFVRCQDCNSYILIDAVRVFDTTARKWMLICPECSEKRIVKDRQYRNTPFAFAARIQ